MKLVRMVLVAGLVFLFAGVSFAQTPIDPVIGVGGGSGSVAITSPMFSILSPSGTSPSGSDCFLTQGGGTPIDAPGCFFQNEITQNEVGQSITQLAFVVNDTAFSGTLTCQTFTQQGFGSPFSMCTVTPPTGDPSHTVTFFDGSIPFGSDFSFEFDTFNANTTFAGTATVPEPGTLALFMSGMSGLLVARRRLRVR